MLRRLTRGIDWTDVALALGLTVVGVIGSLSADEYAGGRNRLTLALLLQTVPLVWRRTAPLRAVALSALGVGIEVAGVAAWGDVAGFLGYLALAYSVPRWAPGRDRLVAGAVLAAGFVVHLASQPNDGLTEVVGSIVSAGVLTGAAWGFGTAMQTRAERLRTLEESAAEREQRWADERRSVVEEERRRIARDLHDIVGHALAAISLSAGGAAACLPEDDDVRTSLALIGSTSREAAADVRRLVGLLRTEDDENSTAPQPTLASISELVARARGSGLDVQLDGRGEGRDIPLGAQLAVYRIVQEGLTNAAKHAPGTPVRVSLRCDVEAVEVEVVNGPPAVSVPPPIEPGHGLLGLRERVALYDGVLRAGPCEGGSGFRLAARIPCR